MLCKAMWLDLPNERRMMEKEEPQFFRFSFSLPWQSGSLGFLGGAAKGLWRLYQHGFFSDFEEPRMPILLPPEMNMKHKLEIKLLY